MKQYDSILINMTSDEVNAMIDNQIQWFLNEGYEELGKNKIPAYIRVGKCK